MQVRTQSELRVQPMEDPARANIIIEREMLRKLKVEAAKMDTTVSEIIRVLIAGYLRHLDDSGEGARS